MVHEVVHHVLHGIVGDAVEPVALHEEPVAVAGLFDQALGFLFLRDNRHAVVGRHFLAFEANELAEFAVVFGQQHVLLPLHLAFKRVLGEVHE